MQMSPDDAALSSPHEASYRPFATHPKGLLLHITVGPHVTDQLSPSGKAAQSSHATQQGCSNLFIQLSGLSIVCS